MSLIKIESTQFLGKFPLKGFQKAQSIETRICLHVKGLPLALPETPKTLLSIPKEACQDQSTMLFLLDAVGIASIICQFIQSASRAIPFLGLLAAPLYVYHAFSAAKERFKLMATALRVSAISSFIFWGGRALDAFGTTINTSATTIKAATKIAGVAHIALLTLIFTKILPVAFIALGGLGVLFEGWALTRKINSFTKFSAKAVGTEDNLQALKSLFKYIQGPEGELASKEFIDSNFTSESRTGEIRDRIDRFLNQHRLCDISHMRAKLIEKGPAIASRLAMLQGKQVATHIQELESLFMKIKEMRYGDELGVMEELIAFHQKATKLVVHDSFKEELIFNLNKLEAFKSSLLQQGKEITETVRSEMHRNMLVSVFALLLALMSIVSGTLVLTAPHYQLIATILNLTGGSLEMSTIIFDKWVSQRQFKSLDPFLSPRP